MRKLTRTFFVIALTLLFATVCVAQRRGKSRKPRARTQIPEISVIAPVGPADDGSFSKQVGQAEVTYTGRQDETNVIVDLPKIYGRQGYVMGFDASYTVKGKKVVRPDSVQLAVYFPPKYRAFRKPVELVVESDAGQFNFGVMETGLTERIDFANGTTWKGQAALVDFASFERVVGSKSVTLRLAGIAFELKGKQMEALRDLVRAIEQ